MISTFLEKAATMLGFRSLSGRGWSWVLAESTLAPAPSCEILWKKVVGTTMLPPAVSSCVLWVCVASWTWLVHCLVKV